MAKGRDGVRLVAEGGKVDTLKSELKGKATDVIAAGMDDKIKPGKSLTLTVQAKPGDVISAITMLAATNDGFTGVDSMAQPADGAATVEAEAYDAGTEDNTEKSSDVPAPAMGKGRTPSKPQAKIAAHAGAEGNGDLSKEKHGWKGPVAKISVKKV